MPFLSEAEVETALLEQLASLGYAIANDEVIGPDGGAPERAGQKLHHPTSVLELSTETCA